MIEAQAGEIERLRQALERFANPGNWIYTDLEQEKVWDWHTASWCDPDTTKDDEFYLPFTIAQKALDGAKLEDRHQMQMGVKGVFTCTSSS
jgi:hypothetical protein